MYLSQINQSPNISGLDNSNLFFHKNFYYYAVEPPQSLQPKLSNQLPQQTKEQNQIKLDKQNNFNKTVLLYGGIGLGILIIILLLTKK